MTIKQNDEILNIEIVKRFYYYLRLQRNYYFCILEYFY